MLRSLRISRLWKSSIEGSPLRRHSASPRPASSLCKPYLLDSRFSLDPAGEAAVPGKFLKWASVGFCRGLKFATRFTPLQPKPLESIIDLERAKSYSLEDLVSVWDGDVRRAEGISIFSGEPFRWYMISNNPSKQINVHNGEHRVSPYLVRTFASNYSTQSSKGTPKEEMRKDISTVEDPFDAPTYNIPEKPVTFTEGASYSVIILAGLGVAALAAYAVFKELIFEPKEYKIFGKALERVKNDNQITVRIGSPVTGYGSESRNRAARQRIPHRVWTDEDGIEHVEVNFYIRGPHGSGKVYSEMFKDPADRTWKYTFLIVEITSPSRAQLMLESYVPA